MCSQKGNVLFLILIAVALFAALSYAVTSSTRGGGNVQKEDVALQAAQIIQFFGSVKAEVDRMRISRNVPVENLDFGSKVYSRYQATPTPWPNNPNCTNNDCRVYSSNGGSIPDRTFQNMDFSLAWSSAHPYPGHPVVSRGDVIGVGTTKQDLILSVVGLSEDVCRELNRKIGLPDSILGSTENFQSLGAVGQYYWELDQSAVLQIGDQATGLQGQMSGCMKYDSFNYVFYQVLVPR